MQYRMPYRMQCDIACDKKDIASVKNPDIAYYASLLSVSAYYIV